MTEQHTDELAIRSLMAEYEKALNTSDATAAVAVSPADGVFYPYNLPTATGAGELLAAYEQTFAAIKLEIAAILDAPDSPFMGPAITRKPDACAAGALAVRGAEIVTA